MRVITFAPVELKEVAVPLSDNLPAALKDAWFPRNMEAYDQGYGCIWYRTILPGWSRRRCHPGSGNS